MKPILDACCGGKMFYFDKHDERVLFQDIRKIDTILCDGRHFSVEPDVLADFRSMPYPDNSFRMVVFDPPHLKYTGSKKEAQNWQMKKYGCLPAHGWKEVLRQGFAECFRVLENGGFLIFKWNETDIKVGEILSLTPYKPVFGHISGKRANTHWICFLKDGTLCDTPHYSAASVWPRSSSRHARMGKCVPLRDKPIRKASIGILVPKFRFL